MRLLIVSALVALFALGAVVPTAQADDASLFSAYDARQGTNLKAAGEQYLKWSRRWYRANGTVRAGRGVIRANRAINGALSLIGSEIRAQEPSTENGKAAKRYALAEIKYWRAANIGESRGVRAWIGYHNKRSNRLLRRSARVMKNRVFPNGRRAVKAFKAAGFSSPNRALSQRP